MSKDVRARVKTVSRDVLSLADHATFLSQKISFLLDATLGMISIEQNAIKGPSAPSASSVRGCSSPK